MSFGVIGVDVYGVGDGGVRFGCLGEGGGRGEGARVDGEEVERVGRGDGREVL